MDERDLVGYGKNPPKVEWPGGARLAVNVVLNYEIGAERNPLYGDPQRETSGETPNFPLPLQERHLGMENIYDYGTRVGVWRILRLLAEYEVKGTIFACGQALERNPGVAREFTAQGHDIVGHGYRWINHRGMDSEAERAEVRKAARAIEETTGFRIRGWFCRFLRGSNTQRRRILREEGFLFDSTDFSDDLPYYVLLDREPFLIVPYSTQDTNDMGLLRGPWANGEQFFQALVEAFEMFYREGATNPKLMSIGLHERITGRPAIARGLDRFLECARRFPDVWFARRTDVAEWWCQRYPP